MNGAFSYGSSAWRTFSRKSSQRCQREISIVDRRVGFLWPLTYLLPLLGPVRNEYRRLP